MGDRHSLAGCFLIATPSLKDPNFEKTVMFMCAHSSEGALGLVINQPYPATMDEVMGQLGLSWDRPGDAPVFQGGPVALERGFILFEGEVDIPGHMEVVPQLFMGTNPEILGYLARRDGHERFFFCLGYAGWSGGQLESELRENAWLVGKLDRDILFEMDPDRRWRAAIAATGIDLVRFVESRGMMN
ncbi:MAG: YqgE/AlgH family protein [Magnetococcales bacterium]|nr:YqgE/AlgH family protein [Magnetococcales bacterium]MBF0156064.1 YqgE/AlgH family protein [Magnetococcales bacterium]